MSMSHDDVARIDALERQNAQLKWAVAACALLFLVGGWRGCQAAPETSEGEPVVADVLRAHRLVIQDSLGNTVISLSSSSQPLRAGGGGQLLMIGDRGGILMNANPHGAHLFLNSNSPHDSTHRIALVASEGESSCKLAHHGATADLFASDDSGLRISDGQKQAMLAVSKKTAAVGVTDGPAGILAAVYSGKPALGGTDQSGNVVFSEPP